eukprot:CAMPEP_0115247428 /NCGR_PEP_ID=MMETSP0270-20121206/41546_1 /TAXON_ID=71861 /ORGANISM="Scrippsiella trochoidea, Strain CCMP3099" /LENGTH=474 /DNA_ID=CAMNT_0002662691 /DNA_START=35 /DNA_END=1459 /DNA_ORIENTATION=+
MVEGPVVLVTGATGLIGREVCRLLSSRGIAVRRCDRIPADGEGDEGYAQCDLGDATGLRKACKGCDIVVHLGGVSGPGCVFDPPLDAATVALTNISGTLNVLEAARAGGARRVVFASSVWVYCRPSLAPASRLSPAPLLSEDHTVEAIDTYAASKITGEQLCRAYAAEGLVDSVSLRLGWVYGPGRTTQCCIRDLLQGQPSGLEPTHPRNYIYVEDAARAVILAALRPTAFGGMVLNVSGGHVTHGEVEHAAESALGRSIEKRWASPSDPAVPPMDLARAALELEWRPRVQLEDGVRRYAEHLGACAKRDLSQWLGLWRWNTQRCERAFEYYMFWGTLTEEQARECATSAKEFRHTQVEEDLLQIQFSAADTTRNVDCSYSIVIDGWPHDIDANLRTRANNSIKQNPSGQWTHWWEGSHLVMEQPCLVRGEELVHRLTRAVSGDHLSCYELVMVQATREERLRAMHAYTRVQES